MDEVLRDIIEKLRQGDYQNEEHVRFSLVGRLLFELGWDVWNPTEVNTEFAAVPAEDRTRVDVALFAKSYSPSVYLEVKAVGKIGQDLSEVERQVRDYNRNNTALFSAITDGRTWRFYYSQTGGEFHEKCFKECDFLKDDLEDLQQTFLVFLGKECILSGRAEEQARKYLQLTNKQKAVQNCLAQARRLVQSPPYPSLPKAIVKLVEQKGIVFSESEAAELLERMPEVATPAPTPQEPPPRAAWAPPTHPLKPGASDRATPLLNPDNPGDLQHTRVEGTIGGKYGKNWKNLVKIGIRLALQSGDDVRTLNALLPANIKEEIYTGEGYSPIDDLDVSVQAMDSNKSENTLVLLAKKLGCPLELTVSWSGKSPRAGDQGLIRWEP